MFKIEVKENDVNKRLDNFIAKCYPNLLKVLINKLIRTKKIKVNQKKVENNYRLQINDEINFYVNEDTLNNKNHLMDMAFCLGFDSNVYSPIMEDGEVIKPPICFSEVDGVTRTFYDVPCFSYPPKHTYRLELDNQSSINILFIITK